MSPSFRLCLALLAVMAGCCLPFIQATSVVGDPGMVNPALHVMWEGWNFCNQVHTHPSRSPFPLFPAPPPSSHPPLCPLSLQAGNVSAFPGEISLPPSAFAASSIGAWYTPGTSPRFADCLSPSLSPLVSLSDNLLSYPDPIPGSPLPLSSGVNYYAQEKGRYLGTLCQEQTPGGRQWEWWSVMIKNGNLDLTANQCPYTTILTSPPSSPTPHRTHRLPSTHSESAATKLMNQPLVFQHFTAPHPLQPTTQAGGVVGTFTMTDAAVAQVQRCIGAESFPSQCTDLALNMSFFLTTWRRDNSSATASWIFSHQLVTDAGYPWLMLYQRADASQYYNGGYNWIAPGMMTVHELASDRYPHFHLHIFFNITRNTSPGAQFYFPEVGGCWQTDGVSSCNGDPHHDVTRYVNFMPQPGLLGHGSCQPSSPGHCPPTHTFRDGTVVANTNKTHFPYTCYWLYCGPPGSKVAGTSTCDPYSNPNPQELIQILPCDEWSQWGFPKPREGWVGDPRLWDLDVGGMVNTHLYFYRNSTQGGPTVKRWVSLEVGPEIFNANQVAEWSISQWDIQVNDTATQRTKSIRLSNDGAKSLRK